MLNESKFRFPLRNNEVLLTVMCALLMIVFPLKAQNVTNKLGGITTTETYDVTDSADKVLFRVQGDGKVGIGKTNPAVVLDVVTNQYDQTIPSLTVTNTANPIGGKWFPLLGGYAPDANGGTKVQLAFGKSATTYNRVEMNYYHSGDGSINNFL